MLQEFEKVAAQAHARQIDKDVARYIAAVERADLTTMGEILAFAEGDEELSSAIWDAALEMAADEPPLSEEARSRIAERLRAIIDNIQ